MSIPYYDDLYNFPNRHHKQFDCHRCHPEHGLRPSYAQETSKSIDIYDKFNHLRYNVTLSSQVFYDGRCYKTIVSQTLPEGLVAFLEVPACGWQDDYHKALEDFRACVDKYQSLVNAEMRDFKDIEVYKDQIDYRVQKPKCCDTCRWCMKTLEGYEQPCWGHRWHRPQGKVVKRQCCSPENEQVFNYAKQYPQMPCGHGPSSWQKLPWQKPEDIDFLKSEWDPRKFPSIIFPVVDAMGICDNYSYGECTYETFKECKDPTRRLAETIAPAYTVDLSCMPGDIVYYCGRMYECVVPHPGGMWDRQHFKPTSVGGEFKRVNGEISGINERLDGVDDDIKRINGELDDVDKQFKQVGKKFNEVDKKFTEVGKELDEKTEPADVSVMISSALSSTLTDYTTYADVQNIVEGNLVEYATMDYADAAALSAAAAAVSSCVTSSYVDMKLKKYVRTDALSGQSIAFHPTHRQMAEVVKAELKALGGTVEKES